MPLTNADLLADDIVARWIVENSPIKVPFYQAWFWQNVAGKSLIYPRTTQLAQASVIAACGAPTEQLPTVSQAEFAFKEFITHYSVCAVDLDRFQHPNNLDAVLFALAKIRILYAYAAILGDALQGLPSLADPARIVAAGGGPLTLDCLDQAYELVSAGTGRPNLIMSHSLMLRTYRSICRAAGLVPERVDWVWYNPATRRMEEGKVDAFNGTVWLANDMLDEGNPQIFFMMIGDDGGAGPTRGLTGIIPAAQGRNFFNKRTVNGIFVPDGGGPGVPQMQAGEETWVSMPAGFALGSQGALSILQEFATVAPCGG